MRKLLVLSVTALLVFAACGGDDDDAGSTATEPSAEEDDTAEDDPDDADDDADADDGTGDDGEFLDDDAYTEVLAESLMDTNSGFAAPEDEAQCAAERMVGEVGAQRMQEAGITEAALAAPENGPSDLTEAEAGQVADAMIECIDLASGMASGFTGDDDVSAEEAACLAEQVGDGSVIRPMLVLDILEGESASPPADVAEAFADLFLDCFDWSARIVAEIEAGGTDITPEQEACLKEVIRTSELYREIFIGGVLKEDPTEEQNSALFAEITQCIPVEAFAGSDGTGTDG